MVCAFALTLSLAPRWKPLARCDNFFTLFLLVEHSLDVESGVPRQGDHVVEILDRSFVPSDVFLGIPHLLVWDRLNLLDDLSRETTGRWKREDPDLHLVHE